METADNSRRVPAVGIVFYIRLLFYPVMRGLRSNFRDNGSFSGLQAHISITINHTELELLPASFLSISKQHDVLSWHRDRIFVKYYILEGSNVTIPGKITQGQTESMTLLDCKE